jgi:hypothetical protein
MTKKLSNQEFNELLLLHTDYVKNIRSYAIKIQLSNTKDVDILTDNFNSITEKLTLNILKFCNILDLRPVEVFNLKSKDEKMYDYLIISTFILNLKEDLNVGENKKTLFTKVFNSLFKLLQTNNPNLDLYDIMLKQIENKKYYGFKKI